MNQDKHKLLNDALDGAMNIVIGLEPMAHLDDFFAPNLMTIGTAADEKITSLAGFRKMIENQHQQAKGMDVRFARSEIYRDYSADENVAIIVEDIVISITIDTKTIQFDVRSSVVLEFKNQQWKLIHWHASKPEPVESETDTFGIDEWKQKAEELEKLVAERTASLVEKNRELEIEAALERVRAQTMAMHNSEDVGKCIVKMFSEVTALGVDEGTRFGIGILNHDNENNQVWTASKDGEEVKMHIGHLEMNWHPLLKSARRAWKEQVSLHTYVLEGEDLLNYYQMLNNAPDYKYRIAIEKLPEREFHYGFVFDHGFFYAFSPCEFQPDLIHIVQRFSSLFGQTYRRYLDLVRAEAQAEQARLDLILIQTEKKRAEDALNELRITQQQLIQAEKMASLGELTAGIAHEIQNPLNFVNNFSEVSAELVQELEEAQQMPERDAGLEAELLGDVKQNLEKIFNQGQRASAIVQAMLEHSRTSTGERELTDLNNLAGEYLHLAFEGMRRSGDPAIDKTDTCELVTDFDKNLGRINVVSSEMGRVLLNLYNNAFYAVAQRRQMAPAAYRPRVSVGTRRTGTGIEIRISDNGTGFPESVRNKIFQPFFTTKPTGLGTGLGLSLSYDIITKGHGGTLAAESVEGEGSTFTITLPGQADKAII